MTHVLAHRVAFADTDASGRVHWASVFRWVELAEHDLMRGIGVHDVREFPRRAAEVSYQRSLGAGDAIDLHLDVESAGRTSVTYSWRVVHDGTTCITGRHTVVHVDASGRPSLWPISVRPAVNS